MSRDKAQGFLFGLSAGVLVAFFFKPVEERAPDPNAAGLSKPPANGHK
jgi:hypothetical protein